MSIKIVICCCCCLSGNRQDKLGTAIMGKWLQLEHTRNRFHIVSSSTVSSLVLAGATIKVWQQISNINFNSIIYDNKNLIKALLNKCRSYFSLRLVSFCQMSNWAELLIRCSCQSLYPLIVVTKEVCYSNTHLFNI